MSSKIRFFFFYLIIISNFSVFSQNIKGGYFCGRYFNYFSKTLNDTDNTYFLNIADKYYSFSVFQNECYKDVYLQYNSDSTLGTDCNLSYDYPDGLYLLNKDTIKLLDTSGNVLLRGIIVDSLNILITESSILPILENCYFNRGNAERENFSLPRDSYSFLWELVYFYQNENNNYFKIRRFYLYPYKHYKTEKFDVNLFK